MTRLQGADQLLLLAVTVSLIAAATSQDNGEKAAQLKSQVSGTLSDAQPFQAASTRVDAAASQGFLASSTPGRPTVGGTVQRGIMRLGLSSSSRDGYLFVPSSYDPAKGAPMIVALHGSGKDGLDALGVLYDQANSAGIIVLAPDSCGTTWDRLQGANGVFGPDIAFIGAAMTETFALYNVDPARLAIQGFSDGATYALALGMLNTRLFKKIMANSPGGVIDGCSIQGSLPIFMSAGLQDDIFPINVAGNPTACYLRTLGYSVTYIQFTGKHEVPPQIATDTVQFFLGTFSSTGSFPAGICTA